MSEKETPTRSGPEDRSLSLLEKLLGAPAAVLLACVLFVLVNYLSARHYRRFDWTRAGLFTLSPRSQQIARSLREPTDLYVLLGPREVQYSDVSELVDRYAAESRNLRVHRIDPDLQSDRFLQLVQRLGLRYVRSSASDVASESAIVLVRGQRHWEVAREKLAGLGDDGSGEEGSGQRVAQARVTVERAISEALLRVERNDPANVCVATGHGELTLQGEDDSLSLLATELQHQNVQTRAVEVRGSPRIPEDCDTLVIAGPRTAYTSGEAEAVERYLRAGGNLLLLIDPFFIERRHAPSGLESVMRLVGIEATSSVIIEADSSRLLPDHLPVEFLTQDFNEHELTRSLREASLPVLVRTARGLRRSFGSTIAPTSLLRTSNSAWGETSTTDAIREGGLRRDGDDLAGPVDVAMASHVPGATRPRGHREAYGRVVVVGYSYLATNEALTLGAQARFANANFVIAALGWLTARGELVEIPARPASAAALSVSLQDARHITLYAVVLVPLAAALVGIAVSRARKAS